MGRDVVRRRRALLLAADGSRTHPDSRTAFRSAFALDGRGRLLDVGCGPGTVTLLLAPLFAQVVGLDPDRGMIAEAQRLASEQDIGNAQWVVSRAPKTSPPTSVASGS